MTARETAVGLPWAWFDDGYGDECEPEEPGKRWLTISDDDGREVAVIVQRMGAPTPRQIAIATRIVESCNGWDALQARLAAAEAERDRLQAVVISAAKKPCVMSQGMACTMHPAPAVRCLGCSARAALAAGQQEGSGT